MLPGATLKKRNRKNALDLAGNILSFVMDTMFLILASLNIQSLNISHRSKIFLNLLALSGYSTYCFCQILLSSTLQHELLNFLDTVLLIPLISRMLVFLNYIGLMPSQYLHSVHDLRGRYLSQGGKRQKEKEQKKRLGLGWTNSEFCHGLSGSDFGILEHTTPHNISLFQNIQQSRGFECKPNLLLVPRNFI